MGLRRCSGVPEFGISTCAKPLIAAASARFEDVFGKGTQRQRLAKLLHRIHDCEEREHVVLNALIH